jgi:hypothetical protein
MMASDMSAAASSSITLRYSPVLKARPPYSRGMVSPKIPLRPILAMSSGGTAPSCSSWPGS